MKKMIKAINVMDKIAMILDILMVVLAVLLLFLSDSDMWLRLTVLFLSLNVWAGDIRLAIEKNRAQSQGDNDADYYAGFKYPDGRVFFERKPLMRFFEENNVKKVPLMKWGYLPDINRWQCGACGAVFPFKMKYCGYCGAEERETKE